MALNGKQLIRSRNFFQKKKSSKIFELDVSGIMGKYTPEFFHFISLEELEPIVSKKLTIKLKKRLEDNLKLGFNKLFDAYDDGDFYDLLYITTKLNDPKSDQEFVTNMVDLLKAYNTLFGSLNTLLSTEQKLLIKETSLKIFRNTINHYIHYIGELIVLYLLLNRGYHLKSVSQKFGTAKDAEFLVSKDGVDYLFEVYNVRITTSKSIALKKKLQKKMNDKLSKGVDDISKFRLQPVVWCREISTIIKLAKEVKSIEDKFKIENVCEPISLFMFRPDGITRWQIVEFTDMLKY